MKKHLLLTIIIIFALSCENDTIPLNIENFFIQEIISSHDNNDYSRRDNFSYDVNGKLISVTREQRHNPGLIGNRETIEFQYNGDVLTSKTHRYSSVDTIHRQVSYSYLPNGALHKAMHAYPYTGTLEVQWIDTYEYNADGTLSKKTSVNPNSIDTESSNKYFWQSGNVSKIEHHYNGQLNYESFYTYDKGINPRRGNLFFHDYEVSLVTQNNITEVRYVDYSGLLDLACNPCTYSYDYNKYNLPTKVRGPFPFSRTETISYEIPEDEIN